MVTESKSRKWCERGHAEQCKISGIMTEYVIIFFSTASIPAVKPTQPYIQWMLHAPSPGTKWKGHKVDH
jgi:hypothetical protein